MRPVAPGERITVIDVLRGVALLGIIVANMRGFNSPMEAYLEPGLMWNGPVDRWTQAFIDCLVTGKFIMIFAVLFGLGFAIQLSRAWERNAPFPAIYVRRMIGLALFGVAHVLFLWWGDILLSYAVAGLALLAFRDHDDETLLRWSLMLYWLPVVMFLGFAVLGAQGPREAAGVEGSMARAIRVYTEGGFGEMLAQRLADWRVFNAAAPVSLPRILGLFLFGVWIWRKGIFQHPAEHRERLRRWMPWLLITGLAGNIFYVAALRSAGENPMEPSANNVSLWIVSTAAIPALSLFYGGAVLLLYERGRGRRLLAPFAAVGRMALTNYLLQSVISVFIFYGFGLGLFGKVRPLPGFALALAVYALQVAYSALWLRRFRYGPAEWLWRKATYGKV